MMSGELMALPAIRGFLFDKDGTLIDYQASWAPTNLKAGRLAALGDPGLAARPGHGAKPGRGMVDGFCRTTGLPTEAVAVIGDSSHDMHMAAAAGAGLRIAVLTGAGSAETLRPLSHLLLPSIAVLEQALFA
jgi:phosphoglycolate phosphatase-like HAD superfamily hydrolase